MFGELCGKKIHVLVNVKDDVLLGAGYPILILQVSTGRSAWFHPCKSPPGSLCRPTHFSVGYPFKGPHPLSSPPYLEEGLSEPRLLS